MSQSSSTNPLLTQYRDVYFSVDVETDGPITGKNSMLNLGAVAFTSDTRTRLGGFDENLAAFEGSEQDGDTMKNFWLKPEQEQAWKVITKNPRDASEVMVLFRNWIEDMMKKARTGAEPEVELRPVMVAWPSAFDSAFVKWYMLTYPSGSLNESPHEPFWFNCIDITSFASARLGLPYSMCTNDEGGALKKYWPTEAEISSFDAGSMVHTGIVDALIQIKAFFNICDAKPS